MDGYVVGQLHQDVDKSRFEIGRIRRWKVKATDAASKEGVTNDRLLALVVDERDAAGAMARGVQDAPRFTSNHKILARCEKISWPRHSDWLAHEAGKVEHWVCAPLLFRGMAPHR